MAACRSTSEINNALARHVALFCDKDNNFSPATVTAGLEKLHDGQPGIKGTFIASFNATHSSSNFICPATGAHFVPDKNSGYAKFLHLGTARIWDADGTINEERWKQFVDFISKDQEYRNNIIVTKSSLKAYLAQCYQEDPQDPNSGRQANSLFSSKFIQGTAATAAWDEVFDRLTEGWVPLKGSKGTLEPFITLTLVRKFFEDSTQAFKPAADKILPVIKPLKM